MSVFWSPGVGPKPWWVPDPIEVDWNKLNREIKLGENWDREEQLKTRVDIDFLTKEEMEANERKQRLAYEIRCWNADFIRDLPEEQQWAFVNTMDSLRGSAVRLSNTAWMEDDAICGALYGQCEAKIQMTSRLLGGKYADKLQEAFDWFFDNTVVEYRNNSLSGALYKDNPRFTKFEQLFKQLEGGITGKNYKQSADNTLDLGLDMNGKNFKQQLKDALYELADSVGNKFDIWPRPDGGTWANFIGFLVTDWDNYFQSLINSGFENFSMYKHEIDTIA